MLDISPKRQLLLLFSLYCFANVLGSVIATTLLRFDIDQISKLVPGIISILLFFIPAFMAYRLFSKEKLLTYWHLDVPVSTRSFLITVLIMVCCIILMNWLLAVNKLIPLFEWMRNDELEASNKLQQQLRMNSLGQLLLNLTIFSLVPSFCEELFFRGTMQPMWYKCVNKKWLSVFITAFIFSFLHFQFQGFLPRLLAGMVFGGIFYYTGSLWLSVLSHVFYNGTMVLLTFINQHSQIEPTSFESLLLSPYVLISPALMILLLFYQLQKDLKKKRSG